MLQSTVWNSQYLKKILRIPEDQLKILNNIPGWTSEVDSKQSSPSLLTVDKENQQTALVAPNPNSTVSQKDPVVAIDKENQQISLVAPIPENVASQKDLVVESNEIENCTENINRKERFPLRKSSSLDSVIIRKTKSSRQIFKRSFSSSNIKEKVTAFQKISIDTPSFNFEKATLAEKSAPLSNIPEVEEMQADMDRHCFEKSQFSHSGIQCKMSQDLNLELDASQTTPVPSHTTSNFSAEKETMKHYYVLAPTNQTHEGDKLVEKLNLSERKNNNVAVFKESLNEKSKIDIMNVDESYISLSVPCAQPTSENIHPEKELVADKKEYSSALMKNNFSTVSKDTHSLLDKNNFHVSTKRKRSSRPEKSKKHRGVKSDTKIEYSSEQIKNMIGLMKVLLKQ